MCCHDYHGGYVRYDADTELQCARRRLQRLLDWLAWLDAWKAKGFQCPAPPYP